MYFVSSRQGPLNWDNGCHHFNHRGAVERTTTTKKTRDRKMETEKKKEGKKKNAHLVVKLALLLARPGLVYPKCFHAKETPAACSVVLERHDDRMGHAHNASVKRQSRLT